MSESYFTELNKNYELFLSMKEDIEIILSSFKQTIDDMYADNGFETHGLPEEREEIALYLRKTQAFNDQE